jgi:hypothetical protein
MNTKSLSAREEFFPITSTEVLKPKGLPFSYKWMSKGFYALYEGEQAQVFVGERNPEWPRTSSEPILAPRGIDPSGSRQVSPSQTVTYRLEAKKAGKSTFKDVTVEVTSAPAPPATCSITGRITGKLRWNTEDDRGQPGVATLTHIIMKAPGVTQTMRTNSERSNLYLRKCPCRKNIQDFS